MEYLRKTDFGIDGFFSLNPRTCRNYVAEPPIKFVGGLAA